ncbi:MAG: ABC transporter permease [Chloroflexota bacterium]
MNTVNQSARQSDIDETRDVMDPHLTAKMKRKQGGFGLESLWKFSATTLSGWVLAVIIILTVAAPWLSTTDPNMQVLGDRLLAPSAQHILGTDHLGRDLWARLLYGGRYSLLLSFVAAVIAALLGTVLGALAGWLGGLWDEGLMRLVDLLIVFPSIILALVIAALLKPSFGTLLLALTITSWTPYARLARALTLDVKTKPYLEAARALGATPFRLLLRHILPNIAGPILAVSFLRIGHMLLIIAGLSYLGLGAQPPTPDWGAMIAEALPYMQRVPILLLMPSLAIFLTALSVTMLGQGLTLIFDPKHRQATQL